MLKPLSELIAEISPDLRIVDAETARGEMQANGGLLLDVREPGEVAARPNAAALNVPRGVLEVKVPEMETDADRPIYLHCATSGRARLGAEQLGRIGYSNVTAISCGIDRVCETFAP